MGVVDRLGEPEILLDNFHSAQDVQMFDVRI